jgi:hypothetical protein
MPGLRVPGFVPRVLGLDGSQDVGKTAVGGITIATGAGGKRSP